jgi:hypothetical protein
MHRFRNAERSVNSDQNGFYSEPASWNELALAAGEDSNPGLSASAGGEHPTECGATADPSKTHECHVRISG